MSDETMEQKICTQCGTLKPLAAFYKDRQKAGGLSSWCRACNSSRKQTAKQANPEHLRDLSRAYYARNPTRYRAVRAAYRAANKEKTRLSSAAYNAKRPEVRKLAKARRRARECGAQTGDRRAYAAFLRWARSAPKLACHWCKRHTLPHERQIDHVIPLAKGGADTVANLCVACAPCNLSKRAKLPEEFAGQAELRLA